MDEATWLTCADALQMLDFLQASGTVSDRKLRLFAVACSGRIWDWIDALGRTAVETAEAFADGLVSSEQLRAARLACKNAGGQAAWYAAASNPAIAARNAARSAQSGMNSHGTEADELAVQAALLRDIVGQLPFRPLQPRTFPVNVVGLAQSCYAAFPEVSSDYAILADALAGLGEETAAAHCWEPLHAKGCHVLDWILNQR